MSTIFAPITSIGGAIITIRISGVGFMNFFEYFNINFKKIEPRFIKLIKLKDNNEFLDEVLLTYFEKEKSFTGEDVIEISIHGSKFIFNRLLNILSKLNNFRFAKEGEFTRRALINGKINLLEAEGINYIIKSETKEQHNLAKQFLTGEASSKYQHLRNKILEILSISEALIDFSDEDLPTELERKIEKLKNELLDIIQQFNNKNNLDAIENGIKVGIFGRPNAGKSSLMNYISNEEVAIVSNIAGTTRDLISSYKIIKGIKVKFIDTAGLNDYSEDLIEKIGIEKTKKTINTVDIKIFVIDSPEFLKEKDFALFDSLSGNDFILFNKIELLKKSELLNLKTNNYIANISKKSNIFFISILENINISSFAQRLEHILKTKIEKTNSILILNERHSILLKNAYDVIEKTTLNKGLEIFSEEIKISISYLDELIGSINNENILDKIFLDFCIGK